MPRPPKNRWVECIPKVNSFKPAGIPLAGLEEINLAVEELEAVRLKDMEGLDQEDCALRMGVSRPTFHRILAGARSKIAEALVEGKALLVEGGDFRVYDRQFSCSSCKHQWGVPFGGQRGVDVRCPRCQSTAVRHLNPEEHAAGNPYGPRMDRPAIPRGPRTPGERK